MAIRMYAVYMYIYMYVRMVDANSMCLIVQAGNVYTQSCWMSVLYFRSVIFCLFNIFLVCQGGRSPHPHALSIMVFSHSQHVNIGGEIEILD